MKNLLFSPLILVCAASLLAHPMGNFSVSHYTKFTVTPTGVDVVYALDLAEIPTFELLRSWNLERTAPHSELQKRASEQAREWLGNLTITADAKPVKARFKSAVLVIADGAGNLPIIRITTKAHVAARGGRLQYEDHNFPERAGWKEIVVNSAAGITLRNASQSNNDISKALTQYPPDPTLAPPQDLRAQLDWTIEKPVVAATKSDEKLADTRTTKKEAVPPVITRIEQPHSAPSAPSPATMTPQAAPAGAVVRGDFLSRLLHQRELTPWMILLGLACAFALGAAHALTPGHGKSIVAAYLVGSRGTLKHAAFLGGMVTFTHTISVFLLGIATLFLFRYIVPEKITQVLGAVSGFSIVVVGAWMLYKRIRKAARAHPHSHTHNEHYSHDDHHHHEHAHHHPHAHHHAHADHDHGDGHVHSHLPDEISWAGLVALGVSGGLVPCESALVLLLGAIALGRVGLGLLMLLSFSLGLALVLMTIGVLVLYAKNLLPEHKRAGQSAVLRWISIASPAMVIIVGLVMTGVALGWIQPKWMIG
jgi:nickel/cobalt transporter (NicO) family protein